MQRRLLGFLADTRDKDYFLTTHSNVFLNNAFVDRVFFTRFDGRVQVDDATSRASILDDLGYSVTDNLVSDLIILVEGPNDVPVIEAFLLKMGIFSRFNIKIWPLGGDIMDQTDLTVFAQNYKILALVDSDPGSKAVRDRFEKKCDELYIPLHRLERYAIENYFSLEALRTVFKGQIQETIQEIQPNTTLESQIGINVKKNNRKIAQVMNVEDLAGTDLETFLNLVKTNCEA